MNGIPTLRQLQYFIAVADSLSFSRAADASSVTQSTLSAGLADLEAMLGEKLFTRSSRAVSLTRAGQDLVDPARDLLRRAGDFVQLARRHREPLTGPMGLGVIPTIAPYLLPLLLPRLQQRHPQLDLQLKEDLTGHLLRALDRGGIDVALMAFPYDTPDMEQMILWSEPFLIAVPGKAAAKAKTASLADLQNYTIMLLEDGHCLRDHALAACKLQPAQDRKTFGATSLTTLTQMVQHGYGATLLPEMAAGPLNIPAGVSLRRFAEPQPSREIGLAWRKNSPRATEFRLLGEFIVKTCRPG